MDLLDRYLNAVRLALFWRARREDIVDELRDDLMSRMETREAELGRPLTEAEIEAVLKANGHPLVAAARYRERQYLIGPTILPFYEAGVAGLVAVIAFATVVGVIFSPDPVQALHRAFGDFVSSAIYMVGFATVVAVLLERFEIRLGFIDNWRPRDLPRFDPRSLGRPGRPTWPGARWMGRDRGRWESLWELVALLLFISWWTRVLPWPGVWSLRAHRGELVAVVSPIWHDLYWPLLLLAIVQAAAAALRFAQPRQTRVGAGLDLVSAVAGLAVVGLLAPRQPWFELRGVGASAEQIAKLSEVLQVTVPICLVVAAVILGLQALRAAYRLVRGYDETPAPA